VSNNAVRPVDSRSRVSQQSLSIAPGAEHRGHKRVIRTARRPREELHILEDLARVSRGELLCQTRLTLLAMRQDPCRTAGRRPGREDGLGFGSLVRRSTRPSSLAPPARGGIGRGAAGRPAATPQDKQCPARPWLMLSTRIRHGVKPARARPQ
jgi:hypothetical protein